MRTRPLSIDYHRKARGVVTAECRCEPPTTSAQQEVELHCSMTDASGAPVASAAARWRVGPKK